MSKSRIQCMMMLFLNYTFKTFFVNLVAIAAKNDEIELMVTNHEEIEEKWKGTTDLKCCHQSSSDIREATATLEMKVPSDIPDPRLYNSKGQLLGQAMGLKSRLSYLPDIFSVPVMTIIHLNERYYLSERAIDEKKFCL